MTASDRRQFAPLLIQQARPAGQVKWPVDAVDLTQDPLPAAVELRQGGCIANRQTYTTDVRQETTDDN